MSIRTVNFKSRLSTVTNGLVLALDAGDRASYVSGSTTWNDLSGNRNNGTLTNGPGFSSLNGGSIVFDGSNDIVTGSAINLSSTNNITISFFAKLESYTETVSSAKLLFELSTNFNSSQVGLIISYADDSNAVFLSTFPVVLSLNGNVGYNISGFDKTLVNDLKWHYWSCIFDKSQSGTNVQETFLYIDGIYRTPSIIPGSSTFRRDNTNNFGNVPYFLGARSGASFPCNVSISNLQIYNRALSASEILQNYNAQKYRFGL